jgi:hypothetical protein
MTKSAIRAAVGSAGNSPVAKVKRAALFPGSARAARVRVRKFLVWSDGWS